MRMTAIHGKSITDLFGKRNPAKKKTPPEQGMVRGRILHAVGHFRILVTMYSPARFSEPGHEKGSESPHFSAKTASPLSPPQITN
jgi:hypothetical protein